MDEIITLEFLSVALVGDAQVTLEFFSAIPRRAFHETVLVQFQQRSTPTFLQRRDQEWVRPNIGTQKRLQPVQLLMFDVSSAQSQLVRQQSGLRGSLHCQEEKRHDHDPMLGHASNEVTDTMSDQAILNPVAV